MDDGRDDDENDDNVCGEERKKERERISHKYGGEASVGNQRFI